MASARATTNHDEIREWVEARGGHPARVKSTGSRKDPGVLRIDFPGFSGEDTLEEIGWDEFFEWFDRDKLAILLSDEKGNRFNKLVARSTARTGSTSGTRKSAKKASSRKAASSSTKSSAKKSSGTKKASSAKKSASTKKSSTTKKSSSTKKSAGTKKSASAKKPASRRAAPASGAGKKKSSKKSVSSRRAASSTKSAATRKASSTKKASSSRKAATTKKAAPRKAASSSRKSSASSTTTANHDEIRQWVESRGGFPAHVRQTGRKRGDLGVLRIDYPGYSGRDTLERIDWDQWFDAFERNKLAFLYQDKRNSRFSKLVNR